MTWEEEYGSHEIWANAKDALTLLADVPETDINNNVLRLRAVLTELCAHEETPHATVTTAHLASVNNAVVLIRDALPENVGVAFNKNQATESMSPLNKVAKDLRSWPSTGSTRLNGLGQRAAAVDEAFVALTTKIQSALEELTTEAEQRQADATAALETYKTDVAAEAERVSTLISQASTSFEEQHGEVLTALDEANDAIAKQTARLDTAISTQQETFAKRQEERTEQWNDLLERNDAEFQEHLEKLTEYEEQSRNVLSAVGVNSTATDYGRYAQEQAKAANRWRTGAVVAFSIATIVFLTVTLLPIFGIGLNSEWWQVVIQRLGAPIGAAAVGAFLARESGQHRKQERTARQAQLTLTALEPFIANLPPEEQKEIRRDTARRIFVQDGTTPNASPLERKADGMVGAS